MAPELEHMLCMWEIWRDSVALHRFPLTCWEPEITSEHLRVPPQKRGH